MKTIITILTVLLFIGCYTEQKATDAVNKADVKFPQVVAKLARDKYPCTDLLKPDTATAIITKDSLIYVDCPELVPGDYVPPIGYKIDTIKVHDSIYKLVRVPINLPVKVEIQTITKWFEDSSKIKLYAIDNAKLQTTNSTLTGKLKSRTNMMWLFLLTTLLLTGWTFRKLFV